MPSTNATGASLAASGTLWTRLEGKIARAASPRGRHAAFVALVLVFAFTARALLVMRGGQHYFYDEAKFSIVAKAATLMATGDVTGALVYTIEPHENVYADHIGYKMFGIAPEMIENRFGRNDHVPAYFFSAFSALNVLLLAGVAYRLTGSRRAFDMTLLAAALSATLLMYARFIVPYDLSLFFALLSLWMGVKRPSGYLLSGVAGAMAAWAFFCYFGHWQLAAVVMALHVLWLADGPLSFVKRSLATGVGFLAVVGALVGLSRFGTNSLFRDMLEITKAQAAGANDFRSSLNSWLYFLYAERLALFLWMGAFLGALCLESSERPATGRRFLTPLRLMALGFAALYAVFFLDSDLRHHLVVHGRHSRQLAPFLIVGFGVGLDRLCDRLRIGNLAALAVGVALAVNAFLGFRPLFAMEFPRDFDARAEAILAGRPPLSDGASYYRKVNVDHYTFEPEVLRDPPLETLLASPHPLQYLPYIYEGESQALKRRRVSVDHRMRLVRMAVPENERVGGEPYGMVTLRLEFPADRAGYGEPLLSIGPRHDGDLFSIDYLSATQARLNFLSMGFMGIASAPFDYEPGKPHVLKLFSGSLLPPDGRAAAGLSGNEARILGQSVYASVDGRILLDQPMMRHASAPGEVYAGVNAVEAGTSGAQFSGLILGVTRGGAPPVPKGMSKDQQYGAMHLRIAAPPVSNGTAEPLLVVGVPGRAVLGYLRVLPNGTRVFGVEIWGVGKFESNPVPPETGAFTEVDYSFGSLFPAVGFPAWNNLPVAEQLATKRTVSITVNGVSVLKVAEDTPEFASLPVAVGANPVGGSLVNAGFSGHVITSYRLPIGR